MELPVRVDSKPMTPDITEIYEKTIKPLSAPDRFRLATLILNDIPPEAIVDYRDDWSEEDLRDWTLRPYIDVGFELRWITKPGKDIAAVLRDYRNYVHPEKERSHGVVLTPQDTAMFWEVTKGLARQLLS